MPNRNRARAASHLSSRKPRMDHSKQTRPAPCQSQTALRLAVRIAARAGIALCALPSIVPATPAHAQTPAAPKPADLVAQLAVLESQLTNPATAPDARAQLALDADNLRSRLIALQPNDHRAATWLTDRAAYQLDLAAATGLDVVCIFGLPTPAQSAQVRPFAEAALELAQQADTAAAAAISALESRLLDRTNPPAPGAVAEIEQRLSALVETEQARRIPMLRAMARTLLAATTADPARAAAIAQDAVRDLENVPTPTPGLRRAVHIARGAALIHAAFGSQAQDFSDHALNQFHGIDLIPDLPNADPDTALRARLGMARTGGVNPPLRADTPTSRLEAEAAAAFLVAESFRNLARRSQLISDAVRILFTSAPTAGQIAAGALDTRVLLCEKIAAILPRTVPIASLPPEAAFARAVTLARAGKPNDPGYAAARDETASLFALVADRTDAPGSLRCAARWERAVVLAGSSDEFAAFDALARVFTEDPSCTQAPDAAERTAETFISKNPPGSTLSPQWLLRSGVYRAALLLLLERRADDRWRAAFVRLAASDLARPASPRSPDGLPDDLGRATQLAAAMSTDAARASALAALADGLALSMDRRRTETLAAPDPAAAWKALHPTARASLVWTRAHDPQRTPLYTLLVGETLAYADDRAALPLLAPLSGTSIDQPDSPLFVRFRFALSRAQRLNNEQAKAFTTLREAADRLEGAPGTKTRDPDFWAAWAEMLTILQSMNADGSHTSDLRVQINRLELLDPTLGGPPHAEAIKRVRDSVGR